MARDGMAVGEERVLGDGEDGEKEGEEGDG